MRLTTVLCRVPVIKFRKGGINPSSGGTAPGSCPATKGPATAPTSQPAAAMSTSGAIPDIDLPARYRRQPLSEEEIAHINGGGIV